MLCLFVCLFVCWFGSLVVFFPFLVMLSNTFFSAVFQQGRGESMGVLQMDFIFSYTSLFSFSR